MLRGLLGQRQRMGVGLGIWKVGRAVIGKKHLYCERKTILVATQNPHTRNRRVGHPTSNPTSIAAPVVNAIVLRQVAGQGFGDLVLGDCADDLLYDLAVFENEQGGDAADVVAS